MKYAVGIVLYNPKDESLTNMLDYFSCFDFVYIYDNSDENISSSLLSTVKTKSNVYFTEHVNNGLAVAYNFFLQQSKKDKVDYLCTMDQDSLFKEKDILSVKEFINSENLCSVGIVAPFAIYQTNQNIKLPSNYIEREKVISSGSFINIGVIGDIVFDENYFIDRLDYDFCKQIRNTGLKIYKLGFAKLYQKIGEGKRCSHSLIRHYYNYRNMFYFHSKFYGRVKSFFLSLRLTLLHMWKIILNEPQKSKKIMIVFKAYKDYKNKRMGKAAF